MRFRILAASSVFFFMAACGSNNPYAALCGTNSQIMSNVASACPVGAVNTNGTNSNNNSPNPTPTSGPGSNGTSNGTNNGNPTAANQGGNATFNFANFVGNGRWNPFDVTANSNGWNSDFQAEIDAYLANGGEIPSQYHIPIVAAGAGEGGGPIAEIRVADTQQVVFRQFVYGESFRGGVRVALCDVNKDGTAELVTGPGPGGGPRVRVFDGRSGEPIGDFYAFDPNGRTGINVACSDLNGDSRGDIIVTAHVGGGPVITVFSGEDLNGGKVLLPQTFVPGFDPNDRLGLFVAAGDIDGALDADGKRTPEILVGHASGDSDYAVVKLVGNQLVSIYARTSANMGSDGVSVAAGDVNGDGKADIILGRHRTNDTVQILSGANPSITLNTLSPYGGGIGTYVAAGFLQRTGNANLVTGAGLGGSPRVQAFMWGGGVLFNEFFIDETFRGGATVAAGLAF